MPWVIVKFTNTVEVEAVPESWYNRKRQLCLYPPFQRSALEKAIKNRIEPPQFPEEEGWLEYMAELMSEKTYETFVTANAKAAKACLTSDISDSEDVLLKKRVPKKKSFDDSADFSSSDSSGRETPSLKNIPKSPFPASQNIGGSKAKECLMSDISKCKEVLPKKNIPKKQTFDDGAVSSDSGRETPDIPKSSVPASTNTLFASQIIEDQNMANNSNEKSITTEVLKYVIHNKKLLENIERKITALTNDMNEINRKLVKEVSLENVEVNELYSKLPIKSLEEAEAISVKLTDEGTFQGLVKQLARLGGNNFKECVRRFLSKLLSDEVAVLYTLHGHRERKMTFANTTLYLVIIEAVKVTSADTVKDVELQVGLWLTKANERLKAKQSRERVNV